MTRLLTYIVLTLLLAPCLLVASCSNDSCYDNGSALPLAALYINDDQQTIRGLTVMGIGAPGDSLLIDSSSVDEVYLPLRASVETTSYALWRGIVIDTTIVVVRDTLTLDYKAIPYFHSVECGAMYNFDIQNVKHTHHGIDSVVLLKTLVTNSRTPALRIHFTDFSQ